jgi:hypothetical protein
MLMNRRVKLRSDQYAMSRLHAWRKAPTDASVSLTWSCISPL